VNELETLVSGADIARRLGVSRERIRQLAERDDFPEPLGKIGPAIVWRWADVEQWAVATGRETRT
jgi:predicted DNA-binding transcriptional regulator AlpA